MTRTSPGRAEPRSAPGVDRLRAAGLRVTRVRVAVYKELLSGGHLRVEEAALRVRDRLGTVSLQAVYDVLHLLVASGLAARVEPAGSPALFEARSGDNHHHVVCRACGAVSDVDCAAGAAPCLQPSTSSGFVIDTAEVTYWGLCPACQNPHHQEEYA